MNGNGKMETGMTAQPSTITLAIARTRQHMESLRRNGETAAYRFERQLLNRMRWVLTKAEWPRNEALDTMVNRL